MKTQVEIEEENLAIMITKAKHDLHKAKKDGLLSDFKASTKVLPWYIGELANRLELYKASTLAGKAKVKPIPAKVFQALDSETLAHLTVKTIVNVGKKHDLVVVARLLAEKLKTEYKLSKLRDTDTERHKLVAGFIQSTSYTGKRKYILANNLMAKYHKQIIADIDTNMMRAALRLLTMLAEVQPIINDTIAPPLIALETIGVSSTDKRTLVMLLPWFSEWIMNTINNGDMIPAYHTALVEKPIEWTSTFGGGFHTERFKYNLINTRVPMKNYIGVDMSSTINAVNRLQNTKWQINENVLNVMLYSVEKNLGLGGLPRNITVNKMPYPFPDKKVKELSEGELEVLKAWRKESAAQYEYKVAEDSKYLGMHRAVSDAVRFRDYSEIYFAYFLDFRGRIYPKASNLHPQGTKFIKSLLQFAEGKRIQDIDSEMFLAMHGANTYGNDKETFINKHKWVLEHEDAIVECADDPYSEGAL